MSLYTILEEALPAPQLAPVPLPGPAPSHSASKGVLPKAPNKALLPKVKAKKTHPVPHSVATFAPNVVLYTVLDSDDCTTAVEVLQQHGICFQEIDVADDEGARDWLVKVTGSTTMPQVFINNQYLGGLEKLLGFLSNGTLNQALDPLEQRLPDNRSGYEADRSSGSDDDQVDDLARDNDPVGMGPTATSDTESVLSRLTCGNYDSLEALVVAMRDRRTGIASMAASTAGPPAGLARRSLNLATRSFGRSGSFKLGGGSSRTEEEDDPATFTGQQAVDWLLRNQRVLALHVMQQLLDSRLVTVVADKAPDAHHSLIVDDNKHYYRLVSDIPSQPRGGQALNAHFWWTTPARPAHKVAEELRERIVRLYGKYVSMDGRSVHYRAMRADNEFWEFMDATAELQQVDLRPLSRSELMAMFINLYNVLVIHALVVLGTDAMDNLAKRMTFYNKDVKYNIGGHDYTADDIEHGVLRGNRPGGSSLGKLLQFKRPGARPFGKGDPRLKTVVEPMDPRVHFALVCGAKSCPPISTYNARNLEDGLQAAAEAFCDSEVELRPRESKVIMSKLFRWYAADFGTSTSKMLLAVAAYMPQYMRTEFAAMYAANKKIEVEYKPYDWSLNSDEK